MQVKLKGGREGGGQTGEPERMTVMVENRCSIFLCTDLIYGLQPLATNNVSLVQPLKRRCRRAKEFKPVSIPTEVVMEEDDAGH